MEAAGYAVQPPQDARTYRAAVASHPQVEVAFLSASEIARELGKGSIDLGITGEDLVRDFLTGLPGGFITKFVVVMAVIFILGFFLDFIEIAVVVVPIRLVTGGGRVDTDLVGGR